MNHERRIEMRRISLQARIPAESIDGGMFASYNDDMEQEMIDHWTRLAGPKELVRLLAIGPTLRAVRGFLSITQDEMAKRCQVSRRTIHKVENGSINIDLATLWAIRSGPLSCGITVEIAKEKIILSVAVKDVSETLPKIVGDDVTDLLMDFEKWIY